VRLFFAFHNAIDVLDGLWAEGTSGLSNTFEFCKKLPGFIAPHHFKITYDNEDLVPSRTFVLIGENGVGKTQVLSSIVQSILRQNKDFTDPSQADGRPSLTRLFVLEAPRSGRSPFPSKAPLSSTIFYRRMSLYGAGAAGIGSALLKLLRSEQTVASLRRGDLFLSMVKQIANPSTIFVRDAGFVCSLEWLFNIGQRSEMAALEAYGKIGSRASLVWKTDRGYTPLSSGQSAFVRLAAHLSLLVERGTLLIIDEPETHLHPAFIRLFVQITDDLLVQTGSAAVIATHSAYIVREVRSKQVLILERGSDGTPAFSQPRLRTFGADVGAISFFIFKDDVHSALIDKLEQRLPDDPAMRQEKIISLNQDIAPEAQAQLRRHDSN
jgi:energy-coupling factor transporter ATP-binding protein EcfA2